MIRLKIGMRLPTLRAFLARALVLGAAVFTTEPARAIILYSTGDPAANTTAPTGELAGSGWDLQGTWGNYLGTPISEHYFITAAHVGGSVGGTFTIGGVNYTTVAKYDSPNSDLRIWKVSGSFSSHAHLYLDSDELNQDLVVFGRGTRRGDAVEVGGELKGWEWGNSDRVKRWGENFVLDIENGGAAFGDFLVAGFFRLLGGNVATLSLGDSGGAVFINDGGTWKLAGINYGVEAMFSLTPDVNASFDAAIFDAGGLYYYFDGATPTLIPNQANDIAAAFYASRISSDAAWILSVIPESRDYGLAAGIGIFAFAIFRRLRLARASRA